MTMAGMLWNKNDICMCKEMHMKRHKNRRKNGGNNIGYSGRYRQRAGKEG